MKNQKMIDRMTLAEKCALLTGRDTWHTRDYARLELPAIMLSDGPSGLRKQAGASDHLGLNASVAATCMPSSATLACSWDPEVTQLAGETIGAEAAAEDVQVLLGPGLNTKRNPLCGRNFEYFSEDPYLSGKLAAGFIRGAQSQGVAACPKHYAANSQETRRMHSDSVMDDRTLRELYLTNFEIAVKEGHPKTIMTAYNRVNGVYANESPLLLGTLREDWGFDGAVVTDWGGSNDTVEGVREGMNLEMPAAGDDSARQLMEAVKEGRLPEKVLNERVDQLLTLINDTMASRHPGKADLDAHHQNAEKAAEAAIVLLKNEDGLLPLKKDARVAFIGDFAEHPRFQGAGSSMVNASRSDSMNALLPDFFPKATAYAQGFRRADEADEELAAQAEMVAKSAETVVLCLGLTESFETEGLDRSHMRLPSNQVALLKRLAAVNPNIVVVLAAGSAVEMPWRASCKALVYGGLNGQAGAGAMLKVLRGDVCPSGKLAETFPEKWEDVPSSANYPGMELTAEYREGLYVGYRAFETTGTPVCFPFGFGLSYTTFAYANLTVDDKGASFDVTNTGKCAGAEVAQLYVSLPGAKIFRPKLELKGFTKVQLAPGETKRVTIPFDDKTFRYFNVKTDRFEVEGGEYLIQIASSVRDIRATAKLTVKGTDAPNPYEGLDVTCYQTGNVKKVSDASFRALLGRDIPKSTWDTKAPLGMNDTVSQLYYAKTLLARQICRILEKRKDQSLAAGKPDLNLLFIYNIPFRGMAKMMNGMVTMPMAEAMLLMVNGHFWRGLGKLIHRFFHRPNLQKELNGAAAKPTK